MISDVWVIYNGQRVKLIYDSETKTASGTFSAPDKSSGFNNAGEGWDIGEEAQGIGFYPLTIQAMDEAGNSSTVTYGDSQPFAKDLTLIVYETTSPHIYTQTIRDGGTINFKSGNYEVGISDLGSGVNKSTIKVYLDSEQIEISTTEVQRYGFYLSASKLNSLSEGFHTLTVEAEDYDKNILIDSINFEVLTDLTIEFNTVGGFPLAPVHMDLDKPDWDSLPIPEKMGAEFKHWLYEGEIFDPSQIIFKVGKIMLTADWDDVDELSTIYNLLINNWRSQIEMPTVQFDGDLRSVGFSNEDVILLYETGNTQTPSGIGYLVINETKSVRLHLVSNNRKRAFELKDEIMRCLYLGRNQPSKDWQLLEIVNIQMGQYNNVTDVIINMRLKNYSISLGEKYGL